MKSLYLISGLIEAFLLIAASLILLFVKSRDDCGMHYYRRAKRWLSFCIFTTGVSFISEQIVSGFGTKIEILDIYNQLFFFVIAISGQLALIHLYNSQRLSSRALMWIFMPGIVFTGAYWLLTAILGPGPEVYTFGEFWAQFPHSPLLILRVLILFAIVAGIAMSVCRYFHARRDYRAMLDNYFSDDLEWRRTKWIDMLVYCLYVLVISTVISYLVPWGWYDLLFALIITVCMLFLVVRFINYQGRFSAIAPAVEFAQQPVSASMPFQDKPVADLTIESQVREWVQQPDKPYLEPGLTLNHAAQKMGLGRHRLSSYLNVVLGTNFNGWIASLRIQEVKLLLKNRHSTKSLSEIAYQTGFADLAAMSNAFKKATGITPSAYRKEQDAEIHK